MRSQQSSKDKVLWILGSSSVKIGICRLRKHTELAKAELDDILDELERECKILMGAGRCMIVLLKT